MKKTIWVVKGFGDENPEKVQLKGDETVRDIRHRYAKELGVNYGNVELSTDTTKLTEDEDILAKVMVEGETLNVLPRAKAGME